MYNTDKSNLKKFEAKIELALVVTSMSFETLRFRRYFNLRPL